MRIDGLLDVDVREAIAGLDGEIKCNSCGSEIQPGVVPVERQRTVERFHRSNGHEPAIPSTPKIPVAAWTNLSEE